MFDAGKYWDKKEHRKLFFDDLARTKGFDPLVAENWYSIDKETVLAEKVRLFPVFLRFITIYK